MGLAAGPSPASADPFRAAQWRFDESAGQTALDTGRSACTARSARPPLSTRRTHCASVARWEAERCTARNGGLAFYVFDGGRFFVSASAAQNEVWDGSCIA